MKASKSLFSKYKPLYSQGVSLSAADKKIGFAVRNYAINQIFSLFKSNKEALSENEKREFEQMIKDLAAEKKILGPDAICTLEEYLEFLENTFANVDDEDRNGEVTMKTSASFKLIGDITDVINTWGPIEDVWIKRSNILFFIFRKIL
jgi:hypothetical protein